MTITHHESALDWAKLYGTPTPLGPSWHDDGRALNFSLYSKSATAVSLLLFAKDGITLSRRVVLDPKMNKTGRVWHVRFDVDDVAGALYYGYCVDGPAAPGNRFDKTKVLLDPYSPGIHFPDAADDRSTVNHRPAPMLGVIPPSREKHSALDAVPRAHGPDAIIYELHVRGFSARKNSGIAPRNRGTFAGLADKVSYLKELGVTIVELLPVFQFHPQEGNYWGYMPIHFFSPHDRYATATDRRAGAEAIRQEFTAMVRAFHAAGIEVVIDVVFNHTAEGGEGGPTLSFRGIDNATYYLLESDGHSYRNDSGTGNVLRSAHPVTRKLIVDSLEYWVREMHVDGFRFDLASILNRRPDGSVDDEHPAVISELTAQLFANGVRLIAEPWDLRSYQLGRAFPGWAWAQWNGRFRDDIRSFVKGDPGFVPALATRLYGSEDLFPTALPESYRPFQSVNYITSHDGFCLYDLVSYNRKHNEANGEQNRDGTDDNRSWNCGWEGDVDVPSDVRALRGRQVRNFCALLMLANGTPMFCAGDEFMNTQRGNNNPYNRDDETTWLDWSLLERNADVHRFFRLMIAFRKAHPSLARGRAWGEDVRWYGTSGAPDWSYDSRSLAFCLRGASVGDDDLYVMTNAYWEPLPFEIQERRKGGWHRAVDTALPSPADITDPGEEVELQGNSYTVQPRSVVVLVRRANRKR